MRSHMYSLMRTSCREYSTKQADCHTENVAERHSRHEDHRPPYAKVHQRRAEIGLSIHQECRHGSDYHGTQEVANVLHAVRPRAKVVGEHQNESDLG